MTVQVLATDPNGDDAALTYALESAPDGMTISATGLITWATDVDSAGAYAATIRVTDEDEDEAAATLSVRVTDLNRSPVFTDPGSQAVDPNVALSFVAEAVDPDGDDVTITFSGLPNGASWDSTSNTFSWTPTNDQIGNHTVAFTATDDGSPVLSRNLSVLITVGDFNRPPVLSAIGNQSVEEGSPLNFTLNAADPDGDLVVFVPLTLPPGAVFDSVTGAFSWTPNFIQAGGAVAHFRATDGEANDDELIVITATNAPVDVLGADDATGATNGTNTVTFTIFGAEPGIQVLFGRELGNVLNVDVFTGDVTVEVPPSVTGRGFVDVVATNVDGNTATEIGFFEYDAFGNFDFNSRLITLPGTTTYDVEIADFDGINGNDLMITGGTRAGCSNITIHFNDGLGTLTFPTTTSVDPSYCFNSSARTGDFNGDGFLDIVVADSQDAGGFSVFLNDTAGGFGAEILNNNGLPNRRGTVELAVADFNNDGFDDVIGSAGGQMTPQLFYAEWDAVNNDNFVAITQLGAVSPAAASRNAIAADVDNDGNMDAVFGDKNSNGATIVFGDGLGGFDINHESANLPNNRTMAAPLDTDGDGDLDLVMGDEQGNTVILKNRGSRNFSIGTLNDPAVPKVAERVAASDSETSTTTSCPTLPASLATTHSKYL